MAWVLESTKKIATGHNRLQQHLCHKCKTDWLGVCVTIPPWQSVIFYSSTQHTINTKKYGTKKYARNTTGVNLKWPTASVRNIKLICIKLWMQLRLKKIFIHYCKLATGAHTSTNFQYQKPKTAIQIKHVNWNQLWKNWTEIATEQNGSKQANLRLLIVDNRICLLSYNKPHLQHSCLWNSTTEIYLSQQILASDNRATQLCGNFP